MATGFSSNNYVDVQIAHFVYNDGSFSRSNGDTSLGVRLVITIMK